MRYCFQVMCILLFFAHFFCYAQEPLLEQHKPGQKWKAENKGNITFVFPSANYKMYSASFNTLDSLKYSIATGINHDPRHVRIIYNDKTQISNGFVTYYPWRTEIQTPPSQSLALAGNALWLNMVSIHEYRHVVQLDAINTGFNKILYTLFGDQILGGIRTIAIPDWFTEGDAVFTETILTNGGRGRIPSFYQPWLLNLKELGIKNYEKQYLGSYKHFIPDHYVFGYLMSSYLYSNYDLNSIGGLFSRSAHNFFIPFAFGAALKNKSGNGLYGQYESMANYYKSILPESSSVGGLMFDEDIKNYTNYDFPKYYNDGIISVRNGIGDIDQVVYTKNGTTTHLETTGLLYDNNQLSIAGDKLAWVEYLPNIRWQKVTNTQVRILDLTSGKSYRKYINEDVTNFMFSPSGQKNLTLRYVDDEGQVLNVNYEADSKSQIIGRSGASKLWLSPFWVDENSVGVFETNGDKYSILIYNLNGDLLKNFMLTNGTPGPASSWEGYIYFSYPVNGIDRVLALNSSNGKFYQITAKGNGEYYPYVENGKLVYNELTAAGRNIVEIDVSNMQSFSEIELKEISPFGLSNYSEVLNQYQADLENRGNESKEKSPGALLPYAWGVEILNDDLDMSVGVRATDALMRYSVSGGYRFSTDLDEKGWFGRFSYQGLPVIIDVEYENLDRDVNRFLEGGTANFTWNEEIISAGLRLPLNFTKGKYFNNLLLSGSFNQVVVEDYNQNVRFLDQLSNGTFQYSEFTLRFSHLLKTSHRDFLPRWGMTFSGGNRTSLNGDDFSASQVYGWSDFYFPGIVKHHSFKIRGSGYWQQTTGESLYIFGNRIPLVRGYSNFLFDNYGMFSLEYSLPIWYSDIKIGPLAYFKRFRGSIYYDKGRGINNEVAVTMNQESFGGILKTDMNVMRLRRDIVIGIDINYRPDNKNVSYSLVLNTFVF
ncbi:BamA/TamA family outer membrane protein [Marinigracilibium pacificum]|uniref:Uncharacterized protein n=1 Tax=Marinigracilibium pacificum TaxID=2729599 RepID=A0A848J0S1_9BACT|nr:hypothetical protein [Marinigracilibium pacificum]NMM49261.1 hypothetical protein [Marinigracilibium pacificum]